MTGTLEKITVVGAGAWGTALASVFADAGREVILYAREHQVVSTINQRHINDAFLPAIKLNSGIHATSDFQEAVKNADMLVLVVPAQFFRATLESLKAYRKPDAVIVNCAKGIEITTGMLLSEIAAEILPYSPYAVLSGPTFAHEVARGLPCAVTFATKTLGTQAQLWAQSLSGKTFRPYLSHDPVGAEIGAAIKNVIAIACGIVEGKKLGENAKCAVMTRGMAEIKRFGLKKGAHAETFLGLSGIGDLMLTCHSMASRNFSLGVGLGQGRKLEDILAERKSVSEGVTTARAIAAHAYEVGVEMPICAAVDQILHHKAGIDAIIGDLLARDLKQETN